MVVLCIILGYLLGSVSVSILVSKNLFHDDVRNHGSGNAGATNVARVFGLKAGFLTFLGDFLKSVLSMWLGKLLAGDTGLALAGAACLIGHCFPVFFRFRGGKAVSAGAAVGLMLDWRLFLISIAVFLIVAFLFKIASVASMSGAIAQAAAAFLFTGSLPLILLAVFTAILVVFMHRSNIRRLIAGTEPQFHAAGRKEKNS